MSFGDFRNAAQKCAAHARRHDEIILRRQILEKQREDAAAMRSARQAALSDPDKSIADTLDLSKEYLSDIQKRLYYNEDFGDYFVRLADEFNLPKLYNVGFAVKNCHKHWFGDWYAMQRTFDAQSLSLCHNRFCSNCNHLRQASNLKKFAPIIEELQTKFDLYHCTLTVPNCTGAKLPDTLDSFAAATRQVFRYLSLDAKVAGLDFAQYGYGGAIRCLEIVAKPPEEKILPSGKIRYKYMYHPHYHCVLALKKGLPLDKIVTNTFSYKYGRYEPEKFSELEILLQKTLYLAFHRQKVTSAAIRALPRGYSCVLHKVEEDSWHEVFKYVTKLSKSDSMDVLTYEQFRDLYFALNGRRVMQGYGCFYKVGKDDRIDTEVAKEEYAKQIALLRMVEDPQSQCRELDDLVSDLDKGHIRIISKYIIQQMLNNEAVNND